MASKDVVSDISHTAPPDGISWQLWNAQQELLRRRAAESQSRSSHFAEEWPAAALPEHQEATAVVKSQQDDEQPSTTSHIQDETVKVYPDVALAMLRNEMAAAGRIWLLLQHVDVDGQGCLPLAQVRESLTKKGSATSAALSTSLRVCGQRQLRNLLRQGDDLFWVRDKRHIWLRSTAKVAYRLGVERLIGKPVALPVKALLQGIGEFRAHLYGVFHSGRANANTQAMGIARAMGIAQAMPIARDTLTAVSGLCHNTQRNYESRIDLQVQQNFAVGERVSEESRQSRAWQQGTAVFELHDSCGEQGQKGNSYMAWQLPNSYGSCHQYRPRGRQKRINRELKDLVNRGMPGNVKVAQETQHLTLEKRYYTDGKQAAKAYGRSPGQELYWKQQQAQNRSFGVWHVLSG